MNTMTTIVTVALTLVLVAEAFTSLTRREVTCPDSDQALQDSIASCTKDLLGSSATDQLSAQVICTAMDDADQCYGDMVNQCSDSDWLKNNRNKADAQMNLLRAMVASNCPQN